MDSGFISPGEIDISPPKWRCYPSGEGPHKRIVPPGKEGQALRMCANGGLDEEANAIRGSARGEDEPTTDDERR